MGLLDPLELKCSEIWVIKMEEYIMSKYTLDMDFSSLNRPKAYNWILRFRDIAETAFQNSDTCSRLLGNLLVIERYVHTLQQGLLIKGKSPTPVLLNALDILWSYVEEGITVTEFQDFANNMYASTLAYNSDEKLTDSQEDFYKSSFENEKPTTIEWQIITWVSGLLMKLVAIEGGRLDFEEIASYEQIGFADFDDLFGFMTDACIYLANIPLPSGTGKDYEKATELLYKTPLFCHIVEDIQSSLKTAIAATSEQYQHLRMEYQQYAIIPNEYAANLIGFLEN